MKADVHGEMAAPEAVLTVLGEAPGVRVVDHDCRKPAGSSGSYEYSQDYGLVLIRRGGYWREVEGRGAYLGPTDAFFERPYVEQRLTHHLGDGDRCTSLWLSAQTVYALAGDTDVPSAPITTTAAIDVRHRELVAELRRGIDRFEVDERLTFLVAALTERAAPGRFTSRRAATRAHHHRLVQNAREAIATDPAGTELAHLAKSLGHTRFHLSRVFAKSNGMTLTQYRNRVRVAIALDRLLDGHENLADLAADLGFVDQSHLSRVVLSVTGERLSALRRSFRGSPGSGSRSSR